MSRSSFPTWLSFVVVGGLALGAAACTSSSSGGADPSGQGGATNANDGGSPASDGTQTPAPTGDAGGTPDAGAGGGGSTGLPSAFAAECTGTTTAAFDSSSVMKPIGPAAWSTGGKSVSAGTPVLMGVSIGQWTAYGFYDDGSPFKLHNPADSAFTSSCATPDKLAAAKASVVRTLLVDSHFYATLDLSGTPCSLPAGTQLPGFFGPANTAQQDVWLFDTDAVKTACQLDTPYTKDAIYGDLFAK